MPQENPDLDWTMTQCPDCLDGKVEDIDGNTYECQTCEGLGQVHAHQWEYKNVIGGTVRTCQECHERQFHEDPLYQSRRH